MSPPGIASNGERFKYQCHRPEQTLLYHSCSYVNVLIKISESTLSVRQINNMFWSGEIAKVLPEGPSQEEMANDGKKKWKQILLTVDVR